MSMPHLTEPGGASHAPEGTHAQPTPAPQGSDALARVDASLTAATARLRELVAEQLTSSPWAREHPAGIDALTGGKYVRARAFVTLAHAYGITDDAMLSPVAAALELLHTASLVHDDIIDRSALRRGVPALHVATSEATAILVGDLLFALALEHTAPLGPVVTGALARAFRGLCEGQLLEAELGWDATALPLLERYGSLKTGALFGAAFELSGAVAGHSEADLLALRCAGVTLGLAFQFADDLLDVHGDVEELGKDHGADLRNGVPSLPLWLAYQDLAAAPDGPPTVPVAALAEAAGATHVAARTEQRIEDLVDRARALLPAGGDSALREAALRAVIAAPSPGSTQDRAPSDAS